MFSAITGVYGVARTENGNGMHGVGIGDDVKGVFGVCTNLTTGHGGYFIGDYGTYVSPRLGIQRLQTDYRRIRFVSDRDIDHYKMNNWKNTMHLVIHKLYIT